MLSFLLMVCDAREVREAESPTVQASKYRDAFHGAKRPIPDNVIADAGLEPATFREREILLRAVEQRSLRLASVPRPMHRAMCEESDREKRRKDLHQIDRQIYGHAASDEYFIELYRA
jgi:hypothetical protein